MKFFHLADLHIGFPLKANEKNFDYAKQLNFIIEKAKEFHIDAMVIAGDVFHMRDPDVTSQRLFAKFIKDVALNGIEILIVTGNHEGSPFRERNVHLDIYKELPLNFMHVSKLPEVYTIKGVNFITLPYPFKTNLLSKDEYRGKSEEEVLNELNAKLLLTLDSLLSNIKNHYMNILVAHLPVSEGKQGSEMYVNFAKENPLSIEELDRENISYFALGHLHKSQILQSRKFNHMFVYPGSLDRVDFGEEQDKKGFYFVDTDNTSPQFIENPYARAFYTIEIESDASFDEIDVEKVKRSITRIVINGDLENEAHLRDTIEFLRKESVAFTGVVDNRVLKTVTRDAIYEAREPLSMLEEYIEKVPDAKIKKNKESILKEAREILGELKNNGT
ncbi:MAG: exonuclease SbcCD subunit D [Candidatus Atribacteria bacterium]|nr:exonuclease SbcCD subunit D [Candidatus Atribacteria bacterium]